MKQEVVKFQSEKAGIEAQLSRNEDVLFDLQEDFQATSNRFENDRREVSKSNQLKIEQLQGQLERSRISLNDSVKLLSSTQSQLRASVKNVNDQEKLIAESQTNLGKVTQQSLANQRVHNVNYVTGQSSTDNGKLFHQQVEGRSNLINKMSINNSSTEMTFDNKLPRTISQRTSRKRFASELGSTTDERDIRRKIGPTTEGVRPKNIKATLTEMKGDESF